MHFFIRSPFLLIVDEYVPKDADCRILTTMSASVRAPHYFGERFLYANYLYSHFYSNRPSVMTIPNYYSDSMQSNP